MSRVCSITGKKPSVGNNVSHSNRKTKRRWLPNLLYKKVFDSKLWRFVRIRLSTEALRNLTKDLLKNADKIFASHNKSKEKASKEA